MSDTTVDVDVPVEPAGEPAEAPEPTPAPPSPPSESGSARDYFEGLSDEELEAQGHSPNYVKKLQEENQKYRERWSPYEERFSKLGADAPEVEKFLDALGDRDADTVRQMVTDWYQAFQGQNPEPAAPQAGNPFKMEPPAEQAPDIRTALREELASMMEQAAEQRRVAENRERVRSEFKDLGFDLSDKEQLAEARVLAKIAEETGRSIKDVYDARLSKLTSMLGEKKPAPKATPSSQGVSPAGARPEPKNQQERHAAVRDRMAARIDEMFGGSQPGE